MRHSTVTSEDVYATSQPWCCFGELAITFIDPLRRKSPNTTTKQHRKQIVDVRAL
jgi:hypothetical protein